METNYHRYEETAALLKSIAHPVRICIIMNLNRKKECNVTTMKCGLDLPQSTISTHLAVLREIGVVETVRKGTEIYYRLRDKQIVQLLIKAGVSEE